jgi:hypothetical protein
MAVNLSPVGGVAAQFFTNTGAVLTGGKLYTYAAGTTTPAATFTSSGGGTAWTNPIVLDAAGRVSGSGEIWLTDGINYKFVLKDSNDVLIATYDNISGINSNFVAYTNNQQIVTATAGQTVFNLSISYQPGTNSLSVFVDGVNQYGPGAPYAYTETDSDTVTFTNGLHVGALVKFTTTQQQGAGAVNASQVTYNPAGTGAVATNVQTKERQIISVFDFFTAAQIADVNSCTASIDTRAAINAAIEYAYTFVVTQVVFDEYGWQSRGGATIYFPPGKYLTTSGPILLRPNVSLKGNGKSSSVIYSTYNGIICSVLQASKSGEYNQAGITIQDLMVIGDRSTTTQTAFDFMRPVGMKMIGVVINSCSSDGMILREVSNSTFIDVEIANCGGCGLRIMEGDGGFPSNANTFISPRILYNDGDGLILQTSVNGNTFIGGSIERNGYATAGVGFYNVKIITDNYQPNHFIDLWTEGPCDAHVFMNAPSGTGSMTRFTGWKHFGDGAAASPNRALINNSGYAFITQPTASQVSYKVINGSNSPFRVKKAGGAAIIYLQSPSGATISTPTDWIEDENGNHAGLFGIGYIDANTFSLGPKSFYNDGLAPDGVAYRNDNQAFPWYQSRSFYKDVLFGTGAVAATSGVSAGSGSPEGNKTASPGSIYMNASGGAGTSFYVKESGTGNTGWVAK